MNNKQKKPDNSVPHEHVLNGIHRGVMFIGYLSEKEKGLTENVECAYASLGATVDSYSPDILADYFMYAKAKLNDQDLSLCIRTLISAFNMYIEMYYNEKEKLEELASTSSSPQLIQLLEEFEKTYNKACSKQGK